LNFSKLSSSFIVTQFTIIVQSKAKTTHTKHVASFSYTHFSNVVWAHRVELGKVALFATLGPALAQLAHSIELVSS